MRGGKFKPPFFLLNRDHAFTVGSNWAEGKDLYEVEERRVIAGLLDELEREYCNKYRLALCSFSNYLLLSVLMSKLRGSADLQERLRTVFSGGAVDLATLAERSDKCQPGARAALTLHGADVERLVCQVRLL